VARGGTNVASVGVGMKANLMAVSLQRTLSLAGKWKFGDASERSALDMRPQTMPTKGSAVAIGENAAREGAWPGRGRARLTWGGLAGV
jgi:hypothetical protein